MHSLKVASWGPGLGQQQRTRAEDMSPPGSDHHPCPCNPTGPGQLQAFSLYLDPCERGVTPDEVTMPARPQPCPALNRAKSGFSCWVPASQGGQRWVWARAWPPTRALSSSW